MLEELCRSSFWHACCECEKDTPLISLKGKPWKKVSQFRDFFESETLSYNWHCIPLEKVNRSKRGSIPRQAWHWFTGNSDAICKAYINKRHGGNIKDAMLNSGSFDALFSDFKTYFEERKKAFMEKTTKELQARTAELANKGKMPQSHGGVANLLKVLTKTMQGQGSNIRSIAKVQYTVCMQAGIFIPDEFLLDVQTAADILEG